VRRLPTRTAQEKTLPFEPLVPNEATIAAVREARSAKLERRRRACGEPPLIRTIEQENPMPNAQALLEKIQALPIERIAEIEDFVEFIAARERQRSLTGTASAARPLAFAAIWNNPEDDAYDAI
jgi:RelB antitoxin